MDALKFVQNFAAQFDETDAELFSMETKFKDIEEWCSLSALAIIGMVDDVYHSRLTGDDIRASKTVEDVFNCVKSKI